MSWDMLADAPSGATLFVMFVVASWIIGIAAIILSATLRGLPAATSHAGLGLLGIALFAAMSASLSHSTGMPSVTFLGLGVLGVMKLFAMVGVVVTANLRLRLRPGLTLRVCQGVLSGVYVVLFVVWLIWSLNGLSRLPSYVRKELVADHIFLILVHLAIAAGAVLSLIHAVAVRQHGVTLSKAALGVAYGAAVCLAGYLIIRPAVAAEEPGLVLFSLNLCLLVFPTLFLFCSGLVHMIWRLTAAPSRDVSSRPKAARAVLASVGSGRGLSKRLRKLETLLADSLITEQEYEIRRDRILNEV